MRKGDNAAWSTSNWTMWIDPQNVFNTTCSVTGVKELNAGSLIRVYPNPAAGNLFIDIEQSLEISISDVIGNIVYVAELTSGINEIVINNLQPGVYFIATATGTKTKFVKE